MSLNGQEETMECVDIRKRLAAWVDGELPAETARKIEDHLAGCPTCGREARAHRQIVTALDALPVFSAPSGFSRRTMRAFRNGLERPGLAQWWRQLTAVMRGAVCAAALTGLLCGAILGTSLSTLSAGNQTTPYQTLYASNGVLP